MKKNQTKLCQRSISHIFPRQHNLHFFLKQNLQFGHIPLCTCILACPGKPDHQVVVEPNCQGPLFPFDLTKSPHKQFTPSIPIAMVELESQNLHLISFQNIEMHFCPGAQYKLVGGRSIVNQCRCFIFLHGKETENRITNAENQEEALPRNISITLGHQYMPLEHNFWSLLRDQSASFHTYKTSQEQNH